MELETINRLYLELSQVATATTGQELKLQEGIKEARKILTELRWQIERSGASPALTKIAVIAAQLEWTLRDLLP